MGCRSVRFGSVKGKSVSPCSPKEERSVYPAGTMSGRGRKSNKRSASKKKTVISAEMPASVATDASGEARSSNAVGVDELAKMKAQMAELKAQIGLLTSKTKQIQHAKSLPEEKFAPVVRQEQRPAFLATGNLSTAPS